MDRSIKYKFSFLVFVFAVLLYGNTLKNGYVRDDFELIGNNSQVKQGVSAIGTIFTSRLRDGSGALKNELYRPLTKFVYALEWNISANNPFVGHLFNIILFGLLCVVVFWFCEILIPDNPILYLLATLLFAAHPIHTEVVANIKSIDEILALLFFLMSLLNLSDYLKIKKGKYLIASILLFALSLFSKESSVSFIILIPVFIFYTSKYKITEILKLSLYFIGPLLIFMLIRHKVMNGYDHLKMISKIDNFLVTAHSPSQKLATAIYMLGNYIKLLIIPYPLVCDYSPNQFSFVGFANGYVLLVVTLIIYMCVFINKKIKNKNLIAFSFIWFLVTIAIASNIFYLIGTNFGERLLFAPSLGFCLFLAFMILKINNRKPVIQTSFREILKTYKLNSIIACIILVCFGILVVNRNAEWKSDFTLIKADVMKNERSARLHLGFANELRNEIVAHRNSKEIQKQNLPEMKKQLDRAIQINPVYANAHYALGEYYMHVDSVRNALAELKFSLNYMSRSPKVYDAIGMCMLNLKYYDSTLLYVKAGLMFDSKNPDLIAKYGTVLINTNKVDSGIYFLNEAIKANPENGWAYKQLSKAYGLKKDSVKENYYKKLGAAKSF